jgi:hypothetical protein
MRTFLLNSTLTRRGFLGAAIAAAWLGLSLHADGLSGEPFIGVYYGILDFPRKLVSSCSLLQAGDSATVTVMTGPLSLQPRYFTKQKSNLGIGTFTGSTTSGVPVAGQGKIAGNYESATITITDLLIGDPEGDFCLFTGLNIKVSVVR